MKKALVFCYSLLLSIVMVPDAFRFARVRGLSRLKSLNSALRITFNWMRFAMEQAAR